MDIKQLLQEAVNCHASDIYISTDMPPAFRINGEITYADNQPLTNEKIQAIVKDITSEKQYKQFVKRGDLDISFSLSDGSRFRINLFYQRCSMALAIRIIPREILSLDYLGHPDVIKKIARNAKGLVLVTGSTGSGKTTTLAAIVDLINSERSCHILTLEDPIEYAHKNKKSIIHQREITTDSKSFSRALSAGLRESPDVILIGEMRDIKTIAIALTAAETGHLVLATLHTGDAPQSIDRIIDVFPSQKQQQIRMQLSLTLQGVICQQLLPKQDNSGRIAAFEILTITPAVRNLIREGKTYQIPTVIEQGKQYGMVNMDNYIKNLHLQGLISFEEAACRMKKLDILKQVAQ